MSRATAIARRVRLASVLALGAFAVHQLRYLAAHGGDAGGSLAHSGHGYLGAIAPLLAGFALAALAATALAARFAGPHGKRRSGAPVVAYGVALLAIYAGQELVEGALSTGRSDGLAALFADGGWMAIPLAFIFGAVAVAVIRALEGVEAVLVLLSRRPRRPLAPRSQGDRRPAERLTLLLTPLGFGLARRPPPAVAQPAR
ncbi:MAG TPA: hypothetical protein VHH72_01490 [Solirubrobacterales bacterium]|jgi:hypothetical protein|nr:hypothetical protein [Solirubrobacterales bacterium]